MANPGIGSKFVSVNLNKSYGPPSQSHAPHSSSLGSSRARPSMHGGGGGMVVLSRPRPLQKAGPKLSVPPPLNLPSLRKEHERFDSAGLGGGQAVVGSSGSGSRPNSSGMGWTKPGSIAFPEKDADGKSGIGARVTDSVAGTIHPSVEAVSKGNGAYMPPSARAGTMRFPVSSSAQAKILSVRTGVVLKGEDFPSLHATLPSASGPTQKQKDSSQQKLKQRADEELTYEQRDNSHSSSLGLTCHQSESLHHGFVNGARENGENRVLGVIGQSQKQVECFPAPLPPVHLSARSDWADDERDTSHGITDRSRDRGILKPDAYWDTEFDIPRSSVMPQKPTHNVYSRWGHQHVDETLKVSSRIMEGQEGNFWRSSQFKKDDFSIPEVANDRNVTGASSYIGNQYLNKENKSVSSSIGGSGRNDFGGASRTRDTINGIRNVSHGQEGRQQWDHQIESRGSRGPEKKTRYDREQYNRCRGDFFQNGSGCKSSFSSGVNGPSINDPILNFGKDKNPISKNDRCFLEDPFLKDFCGAGFDDQDSFSGGIVGVIKKKKDVLKGDDFHDPVRESFEAELERVQQMQEQERQRIVEEQERALELSRREEEERVRLAREQEEIQRRLEEEARETAWRAEQEHLEAMQRAEALRIARDEEKQRILMEEERRKQAAQLKLQELEARIAKRQAEQENGNDGLSHVAEETSGSRAADMGIWEDGERMVERITSSASADSSSLSRPFELGSRPHFARDGSPTLLDRGKPTNPWRRNMFENGSNSTFPLQVQENSHRSPRVDSFVDGRRFSRTDLEEGGGFMSKNYPSGGGIPDIHTDDLTQIKGQSSWNPSGDGDHYCGKSSYSEYNDDFVEKFSDGCGQGRSHGTSLSSYPVPPYQNSFEADGPYPFGRSRYSMRQPRVLPPPSSVPSMQKNSFRGGSKPTSSSASRDSEKQYNRAARNEPAVQTDYSNGFQERHEHSEFVDSYQREDKHGNQNMEKSIAPQCDSPSSLSVSSPPNSPAHLSHDGLDKTADSPTSIAGAGVKDILFSGNQPTVIPTEANKDNILRVSSSFSTGDDEEWAIENNGQLQEQEDYDEDVESYQEEEGDDEHIELTQEFEEFHLETSSATMIENLALGFDDGVEVRMPSDECEKISCNKEGTYANEIPQVSGTTELHGQNLQSADASARSCIDKSADMVTEITHNASYSMVSSYILDSVNVCSGSCLPSQSLDPISTNLTSHSPSGLTGLPAAVSSAPNQAELPLKLQFGLFSAPLIPPPVPAIQIGSIQMPLHLHPHIGPSLSHMQPPLFQFGQLRYTSPITQGILPVAPQSVSYVKPNVSPHFTLNKNFGGPPPAKPVQDHSSGLNDGKYDGLSQENVLEKKAVPVTSTGGNVAMTTQSQSEMLHVSGNDMRPESSLYVDDQQHDTVVKGYVSLSNNKEAKDQLHAEVPSSLPTQRERYLIGSKGQGLLSGGKDKKFYNVRNYGSRSSFLASQASRRDSSGCQRRHRRNIPQTEFRVRENVDRRKSSSLSKLEDNYNYSGRVPGVSARSGSKKGLLWNKLPTVSSESIGLSSGSSSLREIDPGNWAAKGTFKGSGKRNIISREDVEAPLQSGIVRVFEQPGIEVSSDEDDFIEVRSKRQMVHDRRQQRDRQIKAKSRVPKMLPKIRPTTQSPMVSTSSNKISLSSSGKVTSIAQPVFVDSENKSLVNIEASAGLGPIGTPPVSTDGQADIRSQSTISVQSLSGKTIGAGLIFETKNNVQTSLGSWGNAQNNQQVMSLTQGQLDEAMKPARFETRTVSVDDHTGTINEPSMLSSSSIMANEISFSSTTQSPINSLLAGEKIQFGAVTSPTILTSSGRVVSVGIGPPCSSHSDIQIPPSLSTAENDCTILNGSCVQLEDCEAEAEAAASAVAVAAISSDDVVGNELGKNLVSVSDGKHFGAEAIDVTNTGVCKEQQLSSRSRAEESLSVALPADLSVETSPISLWSPLLSPQNSSSQILPHFPVGPPPHFPFYDVNPMLGGPIVAFGAHEESSGTHAQSLKSSTSCLGQFGTWQHHSSVDSFYGPPAGFTGPFISPPGGIPGVQGPPHMVVYNHFAPVGQFGQVGLSFMGTTYIPSCKQPDWKHNPTSGGMGIGEVNGNNMNFVSAQNNAPSIPSPIQHLAPVSPILPMASPLAIFDGPPFQASVDVTVQPRWSRVSAHTSHSAPVSLPLQPQHPNGVLPSKFSHGSPVNQSQTVSRLAEPQTAAPTDGGRKFSSAADAAAIKFSSKHGLLDPLGSSVNGGSSVRTAATDCSPGSTVTDSEKSIAPRNSNGENVCCQIKNSSFKTQSSQQKSMSSHQYSHSSAYNYQRVGLITQKGEWSHRRMGFEGRNQSVGADKGLPPTKVKQIYVAKQSSSGTSSSACE